MACKLIEWLKNLGKHLKTDFGLIAVHITEGVQEALKSGALDWLATGIEKIFPSVHNLPEEVIALLQKYIPKALAVEYAVIGFPDNPTDEDIKTLAGKILGSAGVKDQASKLWSTICADVIAILRAYEGHETHTFAERVKEGEEIFQKIKADLAAYNEENPEGAGPEQDAQ
jgi:spore maturation protein SpmB